LKFFNERLFDESLWDDQEKIEVVVNECTRLAGGSEYNSFYKMMLGSFE
jgi:hypothetical protein